MDSLKTLPRADAVAELTALTPEAVALRLQGLAGDLQLAYAPNTLRTWRADWRVWLTFCRLEGRAALPTDVPVLRAFLLDRIAAGRRRATLEHYLATLALIHRLAELPWPLDSLEGRLMWRGLRREYLTERQSQRKGLTLDDIQRMQAPLDPRRPQDARDAALMAVAYESLCRRSELVALQVDQLTVESDGSGRLLIARSKTDQEGKGALQYLSPATVGKLRHWLTLAGIESGTLFRSTPRSNQPDRFARALTSQEVARIFKRHAQAAGLDPERISGHSTRIGAAQDLLAANFSGAEVMRQGRWKTERMVVRYAENLEAGRGAMAKMLAARE